MNASPSPRAGHARALPAVLALCLPLWLAGCALSRPPAQVDAPMPAHWRAPLPHQGDVAALARWWERAGDPLLAELITSAQAASPDLAQARTRLAEARAGQVAAQAALLPSLDARATASRGFNEQVGGLAGTAQIGLQAGWELDLFGGNAAASEAASARLAGAGAQWHAARVSVAAEVALQLAAWRACMQQLAIAQADAQSRGATARLAQESEQAGFTAPATAALASASLADAQVRAERQRMQCETDLKSLVVLTAWDEARLRAALAEAPAPRPPEALFSIASLPAQVLSQRPDVYAAERAVAAASADVAATEADRYPRLTLAGSIGQGWLHTGGNRVASSTWSIGPVALALPLFDAGRRAAQTDAATARYEEAAARYRAQVRRAVGEVEQALVQLASTRARGADAERAAAGYRRSFEATEARWRAGLASLVELEDARRTALGAETALAALQHERLAAWIALYRAAGGGWDAGQGAPGAERAG